VSAFRRDRRSVELRRKQRKTLNEPLLTLHWSKLFPRNQITERVYIGPTTSPLQLVARRREVDAPPTIFGLQISFLSNPESQPIETWKRTRDQQRAQIVRLSTRSPAMGFVARRSCLPSAPFCRIVGEPIWRSHLSGVAIAQCASGPFEFSLMLVA
jgi:hypothetical protein